MRLSWRPLSSGIVLPLVAPAAEAGRKIAWCDGNSVVATLAKGCGGANVEPAKRTCRYLGGSPFKVIPELSPEESVLPLMVN